MVTSTSGAPRAAGRPRSGTSSHAGGSGREQILDAAARLFAEQGYAATATRQIADAVGMRQASLYYHFASKEQILVELLEATVRPSLEFAVRVETAEGVSRPDVALHALAGYDVEILLGARWNVGILYALPDVNTLPFAGFREERDALRGTYRRLAAAATAAPDADVLGDLLLGLVESVIAMRRDLADVPPALEMARTVADSALRLLGVPGPRLARLALSSAALRASLEPGTGAQASEARAMVALARRPVRSGGGGSTAGRKA